MRPLDTKPPSDTAYEMAVIGFLMRQADPSVYSRLEGVVKPEYFHKESLRYAFDAAMSIGQGGGVITAHTVEVAMKSRGLGDYIDGPDFFSECKNAAVGSIEDSLWFVAELRKLYLRRQLIESAKGIVRISNNAELEEADMIGAALEAIMAVGSDNPDDKGVRSIGEIIDGGVREQVDAITGLASVPMRYISTGLSDLDYYIRGWRKSGLHLITAPTGLGKALALDTRLPTPTGWTTMGDVRRGDWLLGFNGKPCRVTNITDVMEDRECFEVRFSNGQVIIADADHQWLTETKASMLSRDKTERGLNRMKNQRTFPSVVTTRKIFETQTIRNGDAARSNHSVFVPAALDLPEACLPIHPYVLGAWLGDGSTNDGLLTCYDPEIVSRIEECGVRILAPKRRQGSSVGSSAGAYRMHGLKAELRSAGLLGNKHIPAVYLRASYDQRLALLQGLMDTDGYINRDGYAQFAVTRKALAEGALELVRTLGLKATMRTKTVRGKSKESSTCYMVNFKPNDVPVVTLPRKAARLIGEPRTWRSVTVRTFIESVTPCPSVPVRCVEVDSDDHLFLASEAFIPTHNSLFVEDQALILASSYNSSLIFTTEMADEDVVTRQIFMVAGIDEHDVRKDPSEVLGLELSHAMNIAADMPIYFKDSADLTIEKLEVTIHQEMRRGRRDVIIVDHFHELRTERKFSRADEPLEYIAGRLKIIARTYDVPVLCVVQQNRGNHEGNLNAALKGTSALEQKADVIMFFQAASDDGEVFLTPDEARQRAGEQGWVRVKARITKVRSGGMTGTADLVMDWKKGGRYTDWDKWAPLNEGRIARSNLLNIRNSAT